MKTRRDDLHVLTGIYALDALPEAEREEFEHHLRRCASCAAEVRGLRETAARLAMAKAVEPPPRMADQVLAATYRTRQLPPLADGPDTKRRARIARLTVGEQLHRRARVPRWAIAVAAAVLAAAAGLGITQAITQHHLSSKQAAGAIVQVVTAPDARTQTMRTTAGGSVTVVVSFRQRGAVVTATGMSSLPPGRVYQIWVMRHSGARSAGLFSHAGRNGPVLASPVVPGDRIGITVEPAGGTPRPTTTPIMVMPLPA